uniref:Rubisco expression protein CbbX n=2 Tax=Karenia mikimotoi TaxID=225107 RepID=A0A0U1V1S5_KARMI|nr:rubisco expression protein CbbX [Karenia mikimotoi]
MQSKSPSDTITVKRNFHFETTVRSALQTFATGLWGLAPLKERCRELACYAIVCDLRKKAGAAGSTLIGLHSAFLGDPGTGKALAARRMGALLFALGFLKRNRVVVATRDTLIGQYLGHTAPRTKSLLNSAEGGIFFLRQAPSLFKLDNPRDFGKEAVEILLQYMENKRDTIVILLSGPKQAMLDFFSANRGLSSRIANHIEFPPLTLNHLDRILTVQVAAAQYVIRPGARILFRQYLKRRRQIGLVADDALFANGREVSTFLQSLRPLLAARLLSAFTQKLTVEDVMTYTVSDVFTLLKSSGVLAVDKRSNSSNRF